MKTANTIVNLASTTAVTAIQTLSIKRGGRSLLILDCERLMDKAQAGVSSGYARLQNERQALMNAMDAEEAAFVAVMGVTPSRPLPSARAVKAWANALKAREVAEGNLEETVSSLVGWYGIERTA